MYLFLKALVAQKGRAPESGVLAINLTPDVVVDMGLLLYLSTNLIEHVGKIFSENSKLITLQHLDCTPVVSWDESLVSFKFGDEQHDEEYWVSDQLPEGYMSVGLQSMLGQGELDMCRLTLDGDEMLVAVPSIINAVEQLLENGTLDRENLLDIIKRRTGATQLSEKKNEVSLPNYQVVSTSQAHD